MNSFKLLVIINVATLIISLFGWSTYYQSLSIYFYIFFIISNMLNIFFCYTFIKKGNYDKIYNLNYGFYFSTFLFFIDLFHVGGVPLFFTFRNPELLIKGVDHMGFVFPMFASINGFFILNHFNLFLANKSKIDLYKSLILLMFYFFLQARGLMIISMIGCFFIYINRKGLNSLRIKKIILSITAIIFIFLIIGYLRPIKEKKYQNNEVAEVFLEIGSAKEHVENNFLLRHIFPVYLYIASPYHNFDNLLQNNRTHNWNIGEFVFYNFLPQSIHNINGNRLIKDKSFLVTDYFNVSTAYYLPFIQLGFAGILLYQFLVWLLYFIGYQIVKNTGLEIIFIAQFTTLLIFSGFANLFIYDAYIATIIFTLILSFFIKISIKNVE